MTTKKNSQKKNSTSQNIIPEEFKRIEELENKLEEALKQIENFSGEKKKLQQEAEEKFLRVNADLQNMKRRTITESSKARQAGAVKVLTPFITVASDFKRAFAHLPKELEKNKFIAGLRSIEKNFSESLASLQVEFFGATGEDFDAALHESMMLDTKAEKGKIAQVFEQGVKMGDYIISHAKVSVGG